jgi:uncharacterized protein (TIGR02145 family)
LKSTATQPTPGGWNPPNTGATNSSGLTALPGGVRRGYGDFNDVSYTGYWWSSSFTVSNAWFRNLNDFTSYINRNNSDRTNGFSVRCLKD